MVGSKVNNRPILRLEIFHFATTFCRRAIAIIAMTVGKCSMLGSAISAPTTAPKIITTRKSNIGNSPIARFPIKIVTNNNNGKMVITLTITRRISFKKSIMYTHLFAATIPRYFVLLDAQYTRFEIFHYMYEEIDHNNVKRQARLWK